MAVTIRGKTLPLPILQGGMGVGISLDRLAGAVAAAGGMGTISTAVAGELKRNFSPEALRVALENGIIWDRSRQDKDGEPKGGLFRRGKSRDK